MALFYYKRRNQPSGTCLCECVRSSGPSPPPLPTYLPQYLIFHRHVYSNLKPPVSSALSHRHSILTSFGSANNNTAFLTRLPARVPISQKMKWWRGGKHSNQHMNMEIKYIRSRWMLFCALSLDFIIS